MADQIEVQKVTNAVLQLLRVAMNTDAVYDHVAPENRTYPYHVLYRIPGGDSYGPELVDPDVDRTFIYQVDSVGKRRDQAEWAADRVNSVILGRTNGAFDNDLPLPNTIAECDRMSSDVPGGVEQEGVPPNAVYTAVQRFGIAVTPSTS